MCRPVILVHEPLADPEARSRQERTPKVRPRFHRLVLNTSGAVRSQSEPAAHLALHRDAISR